MIIKKLHKNCYVPYSHKTSTAVVKSSNNQYYPGVRVENLSFPLTVPAIQNAIYCCLSEGGIPKKLFIDEKIDSLSSFWIQKYSLEAEPIDRVLQKEAADIFLEDIAIEQTLKRLFNRSQVENSQFPVACLLKTEQGYISGSNMENSNWTCGLCAERVAIGKAFSYGITQFKELHIGTQKGEYCSPCGACRQVLAEHLWHSKIHLHHPDGTRSVHYCSDLLPYSFQTSTLKE